MAGAGREGGYAWRTFALQIVREKMARQDTQRCSRRASRSKLVSLVWAALLGAKPLTYSLDAMR